MELFMKAEQDSVVEIDGLTKSFGAITAVDDVSLSIDEGEYVGLIGPNGAGKSTFLNLLSGEMFPTSGTIRFGDQDVTRDPQHVRCRNGISKSYQTASVFPELTVRENVRLSAQRANNSRLSLARDHRSYEEDTGNADRLLDDVGLSEKAGEKAATLPHGELKRLDIAITLATDAEVLLFDEALAGLSASEREKNMELINRLSGEYTIVFVDHNINLLLDNVNRILVMERGNIIADGDRDAIVSNEQVQKAYLATVDA